jgi:hypothetical protein
MIAARRVVLALVAAVAAGGGVAAQTPAPADGPAAEIARALRDRLDAYGRGDAEAWGRFVADDCVCGASDKRGLQAEIAGRPPGVKIWSGEVTDLEVRPHGDAAAVRYRVTDFTEIGTQRVGVALIKAETYVRREGRWLLLGGAETVLPADPPIAALDPGAYDALVGRYEYGPGVAEVVTRDGGRLLIQPTGQPSEELFPASATTFFLKGQPWRYAFVVEGGRATRLIFSMYGRDLIARRVD